MEKKMLILTIIFLMMVPNIFSSNQFCSYKMNSNVWHCSNNGPGISMSPGETKNLTLYCCFAGPGITENNSFVMNVELKNNYTRTIYSEGNKNKTIEFTNFVASKFIKQVYYNKTINGNSDIPVTIEFELPKYSEDYTPGKAMYARTDLNLNTGGVFVLSNVIDIRILIPIDWKPPIEYVIFTFIKNNYIIIITILILLLILIVYLIKKHH